MDLSLDNFLKISTDNLEQSLKIPVMEVSTNKLSQFCSERNILQQSH